MERFEDFNVLLLGAIGAVTSLCFYFLLRTNLEAPVPFHVTPPAQIQPGWKGEILNDLSLKVRFLPYS
jgi:hypothetical protein